MGIDPKDDQGAVANAAKAIAKEYMRNRQSFVWNATNLSRQLRGMLVRLFSSYQASIRIVYLEAAWEELLRRNCVPRRGCRRHRTAKLPEQVLYRMKTRLEVPDITEASIVDWVVR
ncbi:AAA family ATPase [Nostoc sp.]|uniref:AAA family ATPase n=1 Tax=Nostoc sp. TaxID=1180 RepID=UPI002FF89F4C